MGRARQAGRRGSTSSRGTSAPARCARRSRSAERRTWRTILASGRRAQAERRDVRPVARGARRALLVAAAAGLAAARRRGAAAGPKRRLAGIEHIVVIYAENRSFDHLYGLFPGANGIANATPAQYTQVDHDGKPLPQLPPAWKRQGSRPRVSRTGCRTGRSASTRRRSTCRCRSACASAVHRYYQNIEQINGGRNDRFAAVSDAGGLVMGYYDGSKLPMWQWAREYTLADNFFMGAFGGSYLNHLWLICACTPRDEAPGQHARAGRRARLAEAPPDSPASALRRRPAAVRRQRHARRLRRQHDRSRPTSRRPCRRRRAATRASPTRRSTRCRRRRRRPSATRSRPRAISWAWYAGGWNAALADGDAAARRRSARSSTTASPARSTSSRITSRSTISRASRRAPRIARGISRTTPTSSPASTAATCRRSRSTSRRAPSTSTRLHRRAVRRRAHRRAHREDQGEPAVAEDGDHRHLRRERRLLGPRARRPRAIAGDRARASRRSSCRRSRSAATSTTRPTTRRRSSNSSRAASGSSRCRACAPDAGDLTAAFDFAPRRIAPAASPASRASRRPRRDAQGPRERAARAFRAASGRWASSACAWTCPRS